MGKHTATTTATEHGDRILAAELASLKITDDPSISPALKSLVLERMDANAAVEAKLAEWGAPPAPPMARVTRLRQRPRFTVRRHPVKLNVARPWVIKDRHHPHWLGQAATHDEAMRTIDALLAEASA